MEYYRSNIFFVVLVLWATGICGTLLSDDFILVADSAAGVIYQLSLDGSQAQRLNISVAGLSPVAVTYSPEEGHVYWTDLVNHSVSTSHLDGSDRRVVASLTTTSSPEGVAVDHAAGLVFFTDQAAHLITVVSLNGIDRKTIVTNVQNPRSIRVDPTQRKIYWADWGKSSIERSNYDGTEREVIHRTNGSWTNSCALDIQAQRIYWLDAQRNLVQSANLANGSDIQTVLNATDNLPAGYNGTESPHFYGLAIDDEYLYITDWERKALFSARKTDGMDFKLLYSPFLVPSGLSVYRSSLHLTGSPSECNSVATPNGGCSNLCLPKPDGFVCACHELQRLMPDNKTCLADIIAVGPDVIWVEHDAMETSHVMGLHGDPDTYLSERRTGRRWSVRSPLWHWTTVDSDYRRNKLFLADREDNLIVTLSLKNNLTIDVIHFGTSADINGIAVDWMAGNVYWTDSLFNWIKMAKAETRTKLTKTIVNTGLDKPHGIAVWPKKGLLIWSDWGIVNKLEVSSLTGRDRRTLVDLNLNKPTGITIDYQGERIFWCNQDSVEMIGVDGLGRTRLGFYPRLNLIDLTFYDHYLFVTSKGRNGDTSKLLIVNVEQPRQPYPRFVLSRQPYGITMLARDRQEEGTSPCQALGCKELCISVTGNTAECACRDGYDLGNDGKTCTENHQLFVGPSVIYALSDRICSVTTQNVMVAVTDPNKNCFFVDERYSFRAIDFHYASGYLYFSEVKQRVRSIRRAHMKNMTDNQAVVQGTGEIKGIAVDWTAGNLYWTDSDRGQIWVSRLDGSLQKVLVGDLKHPHGIVLDQEMKKLYWSEEGDPDDSSTLGSLKQANMDGSDIVVMAILGVQHPTGLSLDPVARRLYWVDGVAVQSVSLDILTDLTTSPLPDLDTGVEIYDIAVYQDYLLYSVSGLNNQSGVQMVQLISGAAVTTKLLHRQIDNAYDVIVFSEHYQASTYRGNGMLSCLYDNGGCDQLCLQNPSGRTCACIDGMKPSADNSTKCVSNNPLEDNFFLVADDYRGHIYQIGVTMETSTVSTFPLPSGERPIALAYDFEEHRVYWTDFNSGVIKRAFTNGSDVSVVLKVGTGSRVDGLAFDQESRILYYTDSGLGYIGVVSPSGTYHTIIAAKDVTSPRAIVLDPRNGYMYYTIRNTSKGRIERRDMSGENPQVLIGSQLSWPNGLDVQFEDNKLYWIDAHSEKVEQSDIQGGDRQLLYANDRQSDPFALVVQGNKVCWTDWRFNGIYCVNKNGSGNSSVFHGDLFRGLNDLKFYNRSALRGPNVCSGLFNGGCSHFCLATPRGRVCACPYGHMLGHDQATCQQVATCPQDVPNGRLDPSCTRLINTRCQYYCERGYTRTHSAPLNCRQGLQWDRDVNMLCLERTCPLLAVPKHAAVDPDCPVMGYPGVTCTHRCNVGYGPVFGDTRRTCSENLTWSGTDLFCIRKECPPLVDSDPLLVTIAPNTCTSGAAPSGTQCFQSCLHGNQVMGGSEVRICSENGTWTGTALHCGRAVLPNVTTTPATTDAGFDGVKMTIPIIIGIVIACVALLVIIILVAVLVARKKKQQAEYRNSSNLPQPAYQLNNNPKFGQNGHSPSFNANTESVDLGGNFYSNLAYNTIEEEKESDITNNTANEAKETVVNGDSGKKPTSFSNPVYSKERHDVEEQKKIDSVLKGENVQPDLTKELSNA